VNLLESLPQGGAVTGGGGGDVNTCWGRQESDWNKAMGMDATISCLGWDPGSTTHCVDLGKITGLPGLW
jgi:hypothetical protein